MDMAATGTLDYGYRQGVSMAVQAAPEIGPLRKRERESELWVRDYGVMG
jgi:hypothetical protein